MILPAEVLKKVKLLELNTRKLVNNIFAGEYHTAFKGQGMTFADFREYVPGDDVRNISWPISARTGKTYIKTFEEERELTLIIAVDVSGSTDFGTGPYFKGEVMTHIAAILAFSAVKNNDQIGLLLFSDQVELFVPPKKGKGQVHRILRDLMYFKPKSHRTKMEPALSYLQGVLKKRATIFVLSDFYDQGFDRHLRLLGRKHEVIACVVNDPAEISIPDIGIVDIQDAESGEILTVDTSSTAFREQFEKNVKERSAQRDKSLRLAQIDRIDISTDADYVDPLIAYFKKR
ncbi:MAG: DUF58 domain-containing protein [Bdellovibrionia bacterium]